TVLVLMIIACSCWCYSCCSCHGRPDHRRRKIQVCPAV
ncbi:PREDICTED: small integral membrane protein 5-like, partial [Eurypyga helias]